MASPLIRFRGIAPLDRHLDERAGVPGQEAAQSEVARRDLERYYALLQSHLARLQFLREEALLLCDALNGVLWQPATMPLLWAEVDDACLHEHLDQKWGVDGIAFAERLRRLSPADNYAVIDAVERCWVAVERGGELQEAIYATGLVKRGGK